ncbi:MAG: hypothetical protein Q8O40_00295 [Chloroflexota bacterium]|nr:hypothetical protein [Chloroflexota bacterium]
MQLRLLLDDTVLSEYVGSVPSSLDVTLPPDLFEGQHALTLEYPPQGLHAGATTTRTIQTTRILPDLSLHAPRWTFFPRTYTVSGAVSSSLGPLANAKIELAFGSDTRTTSSDARGSFSAQFNLPLSRLFLGPRSIRASVTPQEPWYNQVQKEASVFIVNVTNTGLTLLLVAYLVIVLGIAWRRQKWATSAVQEPLAPVAPEPRQVLRQAPRAATVFFAEPGKPRARIVSSYHRAAQLIVERRRVSTRPSFTLRDLLRAIGVGIGSAFAQLTSLAERALYRIEEPEDAEAQQAETLSERVREEA